MPAQLAPWTDGCDISDDFFHTLLALLKAPHDRPFPAFPYRLHVDEMGHKLAVINSEAAVHIFDVDTIYKPAKIDGASSACPLALYISSVWCCLLFCISTAKIMLNRRLPVFRSDSIS